MRDGLYEASDFCGDIPPTLSPEEIATLANQRLSQLREQWLAELLRDAPGVSFTYWSNGAIGRLATKHLEEHTHTARLINIREIKGDETK